MDLDRASTYKGDLEELPPIDVDFMNKHYPDDNFPDLKLNKSDFDFVLEFTKEQQSEPNQTEKESLGSNLTPNDIQEITQNKLSTKQLKRPSDEDKNSEPYNKIDIQKERGLLNRSMNEVGLSKEEINYFENEFYLLKLGDYEKLGIIKEGICRALKIEISEKIIHSKLPESRKNYLLDKLASLPESDHEGIMEAYVEFINYEKLIS